MPCLGPRGRYDLSLPRRIPVARYVDSFLIPLPKKNVKKYLKMARLCAKVWREHGALEYIETIADDVKPGKWTSFPQSVKLKKGETVVFSYVVYKSRGDRDRVMKKVMSDKRMEWMMSPTAMPFDGKRMIFGGFKTIVAR
jgi:uncharacterized protein YbaA (DUF1428 family)